MERHVSALLHGDHRVGLRARKGGRVQSRIWVYRGKEASVGIRRDGELTSHLPLRKAPTPVMLATRSRRRKWCFSLRQASGVANFASCIGKMRRCYVSAGALKAALSPQVQTARAHRERADKSL
jgi:hypothetical protein